MKSTDKTVVQLQKKKNNITLTIENIIYYFVNMLSDCITHRLIAS